VDIRYKKPLLVQEFIETKGNFGSGAGRHDLRVVVLDGEPVYSVVRRPEGDGFLANVAQGASLDQVDLGDLPAEVLRISKEIAKEFKKEYANPFYSIDFGMSEERPYIFELNNFIGFPLIERDYDLFINKITNVLLEKANI
jgi:glutathione synthase/RimK-type ligase-like ATP-grasp enzyme